MAQLRTYEVITLTNGIEGKAYLRVHSPQDFLQCAIMNDGERAKAGKVYSLSNGATLTYKPISREVYDGIMSERAKSETSDLDSHTEAEQVVKIATAAEHRLQVEKEIRLRLSVNDDSHLTGETIYDDDVIESLGFFEFLNRAEYDVFMEAANAAGYSVSVPCDSLYRFKTAQSPPMPDFGVAAYSAVSEIAALGGDASDLSDLDGDVIDLPDGRSVTIEAPRACAAFRAPAPGLSQRQQRRNAGLLFGVVRRAK